MSATIAGPSPVIDRKTFWLGLAIAFALLVPVALTALLSHDETQYVAASYFVANGLVPYRDFAYLQTPLQPYLFAPLTWLFPAWSLVATRLANALAIALSAALIGRTAVVLAGRRSAFWWAIGAVLTTDSVLFGASVARNDALPFLLFAFSLERLYAIARPGTGRVAVAGLAMALAASAKISYALPAATMAALALWHARGGDRTRVAALLGGMLVGGTPILFFLAAFPRQFMFGVYHYSIDAVIAWQALSDTNHRLLWIVRIRKFLLLAMLGPALWLSIAVGLTRAKGPRPLGISLLPIWLSCVIASFMPMPTFRHYLMPMIPPLLLLGAVHADAIMARIKRHQLRGRIAVAILALTLVAGIGRSFGWVTTEPLIRRPIAIELAAHDIGRRARENGARTIAGLDPLLMVDSGVAFDPRFAAGPFLFRAGNLAACRDYSLCPVTFSFLGSLDASPPDAILTGTERRAPRRIAGGLDGVLDRWAARNGYAGQPLAAGRILWTRPR